MRSSNGVLLTLLLLLAGCAGNGDAADETPMTGEPPAKPAADLEARLEARARLGRVPGEAVPTVSEPIPTGEAPAALMAELLADASARSGVPAADIAILRAESLIFPDGALGCPQPDMVYTQAPVRGYRVVLEAKDRQYDYRIPEGGPFMLCDRMGTLGRSPPPTRAP